MGAVIVFFLGWIAYDEIDGRLKKIEKKLGIEEDKDD